MKPPVSRRKRREELRERQAVTSEETLKAIDATLPLGKEAKVNPFSWVMTTWSEPLYLRRKRRLLVGETA